MDRLSWSSPPAKNRAPRGLLSNAVRPRWTSSELYWSPPFLSSTLHLRPEAWNWFDWLRELKNSDTQDITHSTTATTNQQRQQPTTSNYSTTLMIQNCKVLATSWSYMQQSYWIFTFMVPGMIPRSKMSVLSWRVKKSVLHVYHFDSNQPPGLVWYQSHVHGATAYL